jgi:hypothetical protein
VYTIKLTLEELEELNKEHGMLPGELIRFNLDGTIIGDLHD